jgi:hypothetical protein
MPLIWAARQGAAPGRRLCGIAPPALQQPAAPVPPALQASCLGSLKDCEGVRIL